MTLTAGTWLGSYQIGALLGAGGMGEVYRAFDTRLKREVAIKVLLDAFCEDGDRLARFKREAELLATLNHPNIAQIYGFEEGALILELVEGPTLAALASTPMRLADALHVARQIAEALDAAHERGVVHRDLKPANIKLRPDGTVKVLDFGLAKAIEPDVVSDPSNSPTLTAAGTLAGVIVGTVPYMSPEQARGKAVDKRTDIWAFGCVLYELVAGKRAFGGDTASDTIAAILEREPDWRAIPANASVRLTQLLRRCLHKDPKRRLRDIGDARADLEAMLEGGVDAGSAESSLKSTAWRPVALVSVVTLLVGAALGWVLRSPAASVSGTGGVAASEYRLEVTTPPTTDPVSLAISPDGQKLVFVATSEGRSLLWLRPLDGLTPRRALLGTDDAAFPFWSPDSRSIGFFATGQLKRLDLATGAVQPLAPASGGRGGAWSSDGTILFTADPGNVPILRIADTGVGTPTEVVKQGRFPQFLPDGLHFIYFIPQAFTPQDRGVWVARLDGSEAHRLIEADSAAVVAASGHLLFVSQGALVAQSLDLSTLTPVGKPFPIAADVPVREPMYVAAVSASTSGPIVYRSGSAGGLRQVAWFDRSGTRLETIGEPFANIISPSMSPDRSRLAFHRTVKGNADISFLDLRTGILSRFTTHELGEFNPVWSPKGDQLVYTRPPNLYHRSTLDSSAEELLLASPASVNKLATSWSRDGRFLLYYISEGNPTTDIWALPMQGDKTPFPVVETPFNERDAQFSPDGKWIAFQSDESGRFEVYVQRFLPPGNKQQVSSNGGAMVRWRDDGKELYYIGLDDRLMAVRMRLANNSIEPETPTALFPTRVGGALQANSVAQYVVSQDGQRFLMNTVTDEEASPITVVLGWNRRP